MQRGMYVAVRVLGELRPEGGVARGEQGVFAGVPAEEVWCAGVEAMMFAGSPDFVQEEGARNVDGAVQSVGEAAFFAARGSD